VPEEDAVQVREPNRADQTLNERMRHRCVGGLCCANTGSGTNRPRRGTFAELWYDRSVIKRFRSAAKSRPWLGRLFGSADCASMCR
jgi:hypothetical protein